MVYHLNEFNTLINYAKMTKGFLFIILGVLVLYIKTRQVTTAIKALTPYLSYIIFTKPLTEQHAAWDRTDSYFHGNHSENDSGSPITQ